MICTKNCLSESDLSLIGVIRRPNAAWSRSQAMLDFHETQEMRNEPGSRELGRSTVLQNGEGEKSDLEGASHELLLAEYQPYSKPRDWNLVQVEQSSATTNLYGLTSNKNINDSVSGHYHLWHIQCRQHPECIVWTLGEKQRRKELLQESSGVKIDCGSAA